MMSLPNFATGSTARKRPGATARIVRDPKRLKTVSATSESRNHSSKPDKPSSAVRPFPPAEHRWPHGASQIGGRQPHPGRHTGSGRHPHGRSSIDREEQRLRIPRAGWLDFRESQARVRPWNQGGPSQQAQPDGPTMAPTSARSPSPEAFVPPSPSWQRQSDCGVARAGVGAEQTTGTSPQLGDLGMEECPRSGDPPDLAPRQQGKEDQSLAGSRGL